MRKRGGSLANNFWRNCLDWEKKKTKSLSSFGFDRGLKVGENYVIKRL